MATKLKPMVRLNKTEIQKKQQFVKEYMQSACPAEGSAVDANSNVGFKTVGTLGAELWKDCAIQLNRQTVYDKIEEIFGTAQADKYIEYLESHLLYKHDETSIAPCMPYCVAISMYPFLENGMLGLGGQSKAPKHIDSYCGSFVNLIFAISSQFAGAVAAVEFLLYFHYFAVKDYGPDYLKTHENQISNHLQSVIYSLNQPASARGYQSVFFNLSVFDRYFFDSMFGNFYFPDGTHVTYDEFNPFQKYFMEWFRKERARSLLTFPVVTEASLNDGNKPKDMEWADFIAEQRSLGHSFFSYNDDNPAALASCCRLRNEIDPNDFSYSLGAGGVSTGSTSVMTIDISRLVQKGYDLETVIHDVHKFQVAHRKIVEEGVTSGLLPAYTAGFISLDKQYCTLGVNGHLEAAQFLGYDVESANEPYIDWLSNLLGTFKRLNIEAKKQYGIKFNTEMVPSENLAVKNADWDKKDGLKSFRDCYSSYMYDPASTNTSIIDKFKLHGGKVGASCDGGQALHLNISKLPDKEFFLWLRNLAAETKCTYWTTNVRSSFCNDCGHINAETVDTCPKCGSKNIEFCSRVIGYLVKFSTMSAGRKKEALTRYYH